jgi:VanZ family protein
VSRKTRWLLWTGFVVVWTTLLLTPGPAINSLPGQEILAGHKYLVAKSLHVTGYAIMTILSGSLLVPARFRWLLVFFLMGHGAFTEMMQAHVIPGRSGELNDVAYDQVGVTIGLVLSWRWWVRPDAARQTPPG